MKIAIAQVNPTVGDIDGNLQLILEEVRRAEGARADLVIASELVISGYPPKDLLLREGFVAACEQAVARLAREINADLGVILGHPSNRTGVVTNSASLISAGKIQQTIDKCLLPNYDVFDERRYFHPATAPVPIRFRGKTLGVHICEDAWYREPGTYYHLPPENRQDPVAELAAQKAEILINLSASPFEIDKPIRRTAIVRRHVESHRIPMILVNQVGGNDDLVFDGQSLVMNAAGELVWQGAAFESDQGIIDWDRLNCLAQGKPVASSSSVLVTGTSDRPAMLLDALILGLKDYARKTGFREAVLGLSGGIDSALAAYIAAKAFGPGNVHGLAMPSRYSSTHSVEDARILADQVGIDFRIIPIEPAHQSYESLAVVGDVLQSNRAGLADQNLQARIRGAIIMTLSNHHGWLALATGNKSELAVGYCTLYGDMCGGFAVLADVFKRDVYDVARYINEVREQREAIPVNTITKPPSAELAPNQFDQDTLPPYPILDGILEGLIEKECSIETLAETYPLETVQWVARKLDRNEFKRRQMPPGIKLSHRAFGSGRRMPIAART